MKRTETIPLKQVHFKGEVCGLFGKFSLELGFENTTKESVELVYTFPLPHNAAVTAFRVRLGDENVISRIIPRKEAFKEYEEALARGDSGVLVEQERPNVFTLSLGRLEAEESGEIVIDYSMPIRIYGREMRITFPTVVAPRYIPGFPNGQRTGSGTAYPTALVPDADYITPISSGEGYPLQLDMQLIPPAKVQAILSPSHTITTESSDTESWRISLTDAKTDRDIVILVELASETSVQSLVNSLEHPEYIQLTFIPELQPSKSLSRDFIFLLDISGSMSGEKIKQAKSAVELCLRNLDHGDRFDIIAFESTTHAFAGEFVSFNSHSMHEAAVWLRTIAVTGGTEILEPIRQALSREGNRERVVLLFTDGQVGNEKQIISYIYDHIEKTTLFTLGIDTAVNAYFIEEVALAGNGQAEFVYPGERIEDKVLRQFARACSPRVTSLKIDWGELEVTEVYPAVLPRVYDQEPLTVVAKVVSGMPGPIVLQGFVDSLPFQTQGTECVVANPDILSQHWAIKAIRGIENQTERINPRRQRSMIDRMQKLSQKHGVLSNHTALIACLERKEKTGVEPRYIAVPVANPHGWELSQTSSFTFEADCNMPSFLSKRETSVARERLNFNLPHVREMPAQVSPPSSDQNDSDQALRQLALRADADGTIGSSPCPELQAICMLAFLKEAQGVYLYQKLIRKGVAVLTRMMKKEDLSDHQRMLIALALQGAAACDLLQEPIPESLFEKDKYQTILSLDWPESLHAAVSLEILEVTVIDQQSYHLAMQILSE